MHHTRVHAARDSFARLTVLCASPSRAAAAPAAGGAAPAAGGDAPAAAKAPEPEPEEEEEDMGFDLFD